jgi:ATP-dependent Lhr-like helicase
MAAGEVVWVGVERIGDRDGRIALYLSENLPLLRRPVEARVSEEVSEKAKQVIEFLQQRGASFFSDIHAAAGGGYPGDTTDALWELAWAGMVTNDTFHSVRSFLRPESEKRARRAASDGPAGSADFLKRFRARTQGGASAHGRWSLLESRLTGSTTSTEWAKNLAQQLLVRYGVVSREVAVAENVTGGFSTLYPVLKTMEEGGWVRRGMFVAGMGAAQFAMSAAVDMLRSMRVTAGEPDAANLAASDPANPYGTLLPWPREEGEEAHGMARVSGASVVLINGQLAAFLRRRNPAIKVFLPEDEPERGTMARALAMELAGVAIRRQTMRSGLLIGEINGMPARDHHLSHFLTEAGFVETALGFQMRRMSPVAAPVMEASVEDEDDGEEND